MTNCRKLAAAKLAKEKPGQTLQATALVHEAYIRLVDVEKAQHWNSRGHFFAAAAEAMRRILVETARRKTTPQARRCDLSTSTWMSVATRRRTARDDLLAIDEALQQLGRMKTCRSRELVKLRFFAGLTVEQAAERPRNLLLELLTANWAYAERGCTDRLAADHDSMLTTRCKEIFLILLAVGQIRTSH